MKCDYVYGLERISQSRNNVVHYYVADGQGSIRGLTDTAGSVTDVYYYTAFGEELAKSGTTENEFRYTGEQQAPVSLHRYLYAGVNPVNCTDASGEFFSLNSFGAAMGIQATLIGVSMLAATQALRVLNEFGLNAEVANSIGNFESEAITEIASLANTIEITWSEALEAYREMAEKMRAEAKRRYRNKGDKYELLERGPSSDNGAKLNNWNNPVRKSAFRWYMDGGPEGRIKGLGLWASTKGIGSHIEIGEFDNHPIPYDPKWGRDKWKYVYHFHIGPHTSSPHFIIGGVPR